MKHYSDDDIDIGLFEAIAITVVWIAVVWALGTLVAHVIHWLVR